MTQHDFSWKSSDGLTLFAREWKPEREPRAVVALVHGLGEHSGRYQHVAEYFNRAGYVMTALDLRGHGRSEGIRGHSPSYDVLLDDIQVLLEETTRRYSNKPCFIYGHSLGGSLVLYYLVKRKPQIAGAIVTAPGLAPAVPVAGWKMGLGKVMYNLFPTMPMDNGLDLSGLARDPQVVDAYVKDPLVHKIVTARLGLDIINNGVWISDQADRINLPLLLMQGSADRIINPRANIRFAEKLGGDVTFKLWDGFYHELHNEPEKAEVLEYMVNWLNQHTV